jgi:hypothetical protein
MLTRKQSVRGERSAWAVSKERFSKQNGAAGVESFALKIIGNLDLRFFYELVGD